MPRHSIAPLVVASCLVLAACQTETVSPSPETASTAVPASSPATPIRGIGQAPHLVGQSHWAAHACTSDGTVKVCN
ncbi:hypothetical protein [Burkholderia anthina]|uniref:hypothetical protein n=1 Tax=Burkholderia anthina TaxID=179879 RepID=UPI00158DA5C6